MARKLTRDHFSPVHVVIRGVTYPSLYSAAKALGVKPQTVNNALERGTLDTCGLGRQNLKPTTIEGITYPSVKAAADAIGITESALRKRLKRERKKNDRQSNAQL